MKKPNIAAVLGIAGMVLGIAGSVVSGIASSKKQDQTIAAEVAKHLEKQAKES